MNINICGVLISKKKNIVFGLTKIYGIGYSMSLKICSKIENFKNKKFKDLTNEEKAKIENFINKINVENNLKTIIKENFKKKLNLNSYKSLRHKKKLPCRGQRTKTNAKTRKKMNHEII
ncbi:ribosomal protein S13 [Candidatus Carsonella ruddii PV]|uniref:Small ribosomal subunit protein uS13 n=1 Tax=Carsonella ruddii (strain PV) TaxID=387662 RepID=RS13_CARRP|nr:30S ribosomal protein S13 [Candidatus Carsonella ruddii]Q05FK2.1 RecName: Full=Small ribosomal subunit protein uS13; AltName: Full=30S ribosomal protein S13 [Candidatus Carsonella ruddii PV]BAF35169.1 ribosomal protein S13 [Candidatus Carsonella ruddii PV]